MALDQMVSDLIANGIVTDLEVAFSTVSAEETPGAIRRGKLQDNPVKNRIYVLVHINDPDNPDEWHDSTLAKRDQALDRAEFKAPAFELGSGGTAMTWRRFSVEFGFYGIQQKEDREEASRLANLVRGRIEKTLWRPTYLGVADVFGEIPIKTFVVQDIADASGGNNAFIWRGKVRVMVLTNRIL